MCHKHPLLLKKKYHELHKNIQKTYLFIGLFAFIFQDFFSLFYIQKGKRYDYMITLLRCFYARFNTVFWAFSATRVRPFGYRSCSGHVM